MSPVISCVSEIGRSLKDSDRGESLWNIISLLLSVSFLYDGDDGFG